METDYDQLERKHQSLSNELVYWTEVLQKSEKYERLKDDGDWQDVFKEIRHVLKVHDDEIAKALETLSGLNPRDREDANSVILIHQIRKEQIQEALNEPERIADLARRARERIPDIKEEIRKIQEDLTHA